MRISFNFLVRVTGMLVLAYVGSVLGRSLSNTPQNSTEQLATQLLTLAGAGLGLLTTHRWTIDPIQHGIDHIRSISILELSAVLFGALVGLVLGLLLAIPLGYLPRPFGAVVPIISSIALAY